jgi:hypothetical protein
MFLLAQRAVPLYRPPGVVEQHRHGNIFSIAHPSNACLKISLRAAARRTQAAGRQPDTDALHAQ